MKIAYISTFYPFRGGIAQFNYSLSKEFEKEHIVERFNFKRQYPNLLFPGKTQFVENDDQSGSVGSNRCIDTINPLTYLSAASKVKNFSPDLAITKFWMPFFAPSLGTILRKQKKTKRIAILDNVIPHEKRPFDISLVKYFLNSNDAFVVMSEIVRNDLLTLKPDAKYIFAEHPLYDNFPAKVSRHQALAQLGLSPDYQYLLFFGFIRQYKGLDLILEAMELLPNNIRLIVAGEPYTDMSKYYQIIKDKKLEDRINLNIRYIDDAEVATFFSAADCCVLPYKSATQSGITGISYYYEVPMVATDTGGLKQMIEPHNAGLVANEITTESLAKTIIDYFSKDVNQFKSGILEYKNIASWQNFAKKVCDFALKL